MYSSNSITGHLSSWLVAHILGLNFLSFAEIFLSRSTDHSTYFPALVETILKSPNFSWWCSWRPRNPKCWLIFMKLAHLFNHLSGQRLSGIWLITFPRLLQELDFCVKGFISVDEIFVANDGESGIFFL